MKKITSFLFKNSDNILSLLIRTSMTSCKSTQMYGATREIDKLVDISDSVLSYAQYFLRKSTPYAAHKH